MGLLGLSRSANAEMASVDSADVEQGRRLLEEARGARSALIALSALAEALTAAAASTVGVEAGSPLHRGLAEAARTGYACRLSSARRPLAGEARAALETHIVRTPEGRLDCRSVIETPATMHSLCSTARSLAASDAAVASAAGVSEGAWAACCAAAARDLRADLIGSGLPDQSILETACLARMVRLGFMLAVIDEIAGQTHAMTAAGHGGSGDRAGDHR